MGRIIWDGVSPLRTGVIDVVGGRVTFPPISGETTVATYVNQANLQAWRQGSETAALDRVATIKVPIPCQVANVLSPAWQGLLVRAFSARGGKLIAVRVTCEGTNHILGVPTLFRYRVYYLHDTLSLLIGVAIVLSVLFIALDPSFSRRLTEVLRGTVSAPFSGATNTLMLFVVAGGVISLGFILMARQAGVPTTAFTPPGAPTVGISAGPPAARVQVGTARGGGRARRR